jgi:multidrug efflux pump subunit AcrA (membrane-fusion protein)
VRIIVEEKKDVLVVPNNAVRFEEGKTVVYYLKAKDKTEPRQVTQGIRDDKFTEVVSGVKEGEVIVIPALSKKPPQGSSPGPKK